MNKLAPFSNNQKAYWLRVDKSWLNVAEGGKRAGKNVLQTLIYCNILEYHPDKLHLIAGVSTTTAKLNIADCDGYGIYNFFEGRCRDGKYKGRDCIYINTKTGEKVILISGGGKEGDLRYIKGNTYGTAYITEANECAKSFLLEAFDRTISSRNRKVFHDINPKAPNHWYYDEILNFHQMQQLKDSSYGYNYGHFTIADNYSLSDEKIKKELKTYDKNSIWYKRDIKGERLATQGVIYKLFADNPSDYLIDSLEGYKIDLIQIGIDFGGNGSQHAIVGTALCNNYSVVIPLMTRRIVATGTNPSDLEREIKSFIQTLYAKYQMPMKVRCDSAEQVLINGIKQMVGNERLPVSIYNAIKKPIIDRIRLVCRLLDLGKIKLLRSQTKSLQMAISTAVWDSTKKDDVRLDDGTSDIDTMDAFEYSIEEFSKTLIAK